MKQRQELIDALQAGAGDGLVLIVGGGINGAGVLRDLAAQGVAAVLVERADFASGTSSAPSRLIHGGLRYLETGEFALVRESVEERNHLLMNAPHQVRPIPVWVPVFSWTGGALAAGLRFLRLKRNPGAKGALVVRLGMWVFDRFGEVRRSMPRHRQIGMTEARNRFPKLSRRVRAVLEYYDARIRSPERLTLEVAGDAEADCPGSMAINYLAVTARQGDRITLTDTLTGDTMTVRPSLVVNCAGAWVDPVDAGIGIPERLTGGTKGSHLVLDRPDLARQLGDAMLYFETSDFRACLVYRLDGGKVILGTTDLRCDDPDSAGCTEDEIDYLFRVLDEVMPGAHARREDIIYTFTGVRPLPLSSASATGAISRDHSLRPFEPAGDRPFAVLTLVGGKWTTYRACAAQIADAVLERIGQPRRASTLDLQIGGGAGLPADAAGRDRIVRQLSEKSGLVVDDAAILLARYGMTALQIADSFTTRPRPIATLPGYWHQEIDWLCRNERVARLEDLVLRRTLIAFEGLASRDSIAELAQIAAPVLGWSPDRMRAEIDATISVLISRHQAAIDREDVSAYGGRIAG